MENGTETERKTGGSTKTAREMERRAGWKKRRKWEGCFRKRPTLVHDTVNQRYVTKI